MRCGLWAEHTCAFRFCSLLINYVRFYVCFYSVSFVRVFFCSVLLFRPHSALFYSILSGFVPLSSIRLNTGPFCSPLVAPYRTTPRLTHLTFPSVKKRGTWAIASKAINEQTNDRSEVNLARQMVAFVAKQRHSVRWLSEEFAFCFSFVPTLYTIRSQHCTRDNVRHTHTHTLARPNYAPPQTFLCVNMEKFCRALSVELLRHHITAYASFHVPRSWIPRIPWTQNRPHYTSTCFHVKPAETA